MWAQFWVLSLSFSDCTRLHGEFIGSSGSSWASLLRGLLCSPGPLCSYRGWLRTGAGNRALSQGCRQNSSFHALVIWSNMIYPELGRDFASGMKASNQLTLKDYPGLAEQPWCNHGGPSKQQKKAEGSEEGGMGRSENFKPWKRLYCDKLEEWEGVGGGREVQDGGDIRIPMTNSCWCMAEANTIL